MPQGLNSLVKFWGKDIPKQPQKANKGQQPEDWPSPSAPSKDLQKFTQHKIRVEGELTVRTNKPFKDLNECFSVLYYWLDNFVGVFASEFLVTSLFVCLGSNLSPRPDSYGKILESRLNSVIMYNTVSSENQARPSWSTSSRFQVDHFDRRTNVSYEVRFFSTRMEGLPIENFFNINNHPIPDFVKSLQTMKVELVSGNADLVFTGRVLD